MQNPVDIVLEKSGIRELNPVQKLALENGLLDKKAFVVSAPTASGKTLIAEIAMLKTVLEERKKAVYIVPLRALANEKYEEFKEKYGSFGIKIGISIGDYDQTDPWLANYDIIVVTSEKLDSLLRHGITWAHRIGLIIADEVHLIDSPERGPTLEVVLTRFKKSYNPKILALSATINNYKELAEWLDAEAVESDYRPVKLYRGVCLGNMVSFYPERFVKLDSDEPVKALVEDTLKKGKQVLFFISTRRNAESLAEKLGNVVREHVRKEKKELEKTGKQVLQALEKPTRQCEKLFHCICNGTAFHHAGLINEQRKIVESAFKDGKIKVIVATPTLAAGINLPAWRVVIRDTKRFGGFGMDYIPVLEIHQMMGRAGRPKYDKEGEAILIAKTEKEAEFLWENYIEGEPERVSSKLGVEPVLRTHVLALIASETIRTKQELMEFFSETFYAYQFRNLAELERTIGKVIELLKGFGFVKGETGEFVSAGSLGNSELVATKTGKRVSELYIDPLTANTLIKRMKRIEEEGSNDIGILYSVSNTIEMFPLLPVRKSDIEKINELLNKYEDFLPEKPPNPWDIEYEDYLKGIKTAFLFKEWIEEASEEEILERFGVTPGELRTRLMNIDWLLYSGYELGLLLNLRKTIREMKKIRIRVKYGVKEELLPLVRLRGIGRVRARMLYNNGITSIEKLRKIPLESLEKLTGKALAKQIKEQVE